MFFYIDLSDETFRELSDKLMHVERELRRISDWQQTLTAQDAIDGGKHRAGLYKDFKSLAEYLDHFKNTMPEKAAKINNLLTEKQSLIENLTRWTEDHAFDSKTVTTRALWDNFEGQQRVVYFENIKHIVFDNENRSSAFLFYAGDAVYPTFFGYDEKGEVCILITDCGGIGFLWNDEEN